MPIFESDELKPLGGIYYVIIPLGFVLMLLCLPVILPIAAISSKRDAQRLRHAADETNCAGCGVALGQKAVELADKLCSEQVAALRLKYPFSMLRLARHVYAICTNCGERYAMDDGRLIIRAEA
jgi:hypothetical protein